MNKINSPITANDAHMLSLRKDLIRKSTTITFAENKINDSIDKGFYNCEIVINSSHEEYVVDYFTKLGYDIFVISTLGDDINIEISWENPKDVYVF